MFTDEQINQLQKLLSPIQENIQNLRTELTDHRKESETEHLNLRTELALHRRESQQEHREMKQEFKQEIETLRKESQMEHQDLTQVIIDSGDSLDKRVTRIEKHLHLPPLE